VADEPATTSDTLPEPPKQKTDGRNGGTSEFAALRHLLLGPEQNRLEELATELRERHVSATDLAEHLPEAIVLRGKRDKQIGRALAPTVETALRESIRRNPREIATAIFPILGPAIRKAMAETMSALVRSINSAVEHSLSPRGIKWRLESWRTGVPYAQVVIKHALVYRVEQAFLIHAETGLLLAHATAPGLQVPEADLISGMMTAIQDFVRDSFRPGEGATLRTFSVGDHTVQVEAGPLALLALVIRGEAPAEVLRKQQDTLETVHLQCAAPLAEFSGDTAQFQSVLPLLEECLETVVDTGTQRRGRLLWLRWAIPLAIAAGAFIVVLGRANARFNRAVVSLDNEPGLVVIDAQRGWRQWNISGLRDPHARAPETVLAGAGLAPRSLVGNWEPYLSLDSAVVTSRARQLWSLPSSTTLSLHNDTATVSGELPLTSLGLIRYSSLPPGVSDVRVSSARIVLPPHLDSVRTDLAASRVLFAPGSAEANIAERGHAREIADRFRMLDDSVRVHAGDLGLMIIGRTDPTGTDRTNQALAQWRVDHVAAIFAAAGVRPDAIGGEALATSSPLPAADSSLQARINRSVSFDVFVSTRPRAPRER
jgi:outer membrane protein OmpA-like peptidoglycan-associated protein